MHFRHFRKVTAALGACGDPPFRLGIDDLPFL